MKTISNPSIYLDYAATTPVDARVLEAMLPFFQENFGNTSSIHIIGQKAEAALENSREVLAKELKSSPEEVIFTSCGSESDNLAIRGVSFTARKERGANHILCSAVEHPAVLRTVRQLAEWHGFEAEFLPVDRFGMVSPQTVAERIRPDTAIVSVIYANNEIGTINPIKEIGAICRSKQIPFHTDAVQAAAYLPVDVRELNVDLVSLGAHKFYGPKGVGALYVRKGISILPIQTGGGQEHALRAGTHNTPYIAGMAKAFELAQLERDERTAQVEPLRDRLIGRILEEIPDSQLTGHPWLRLPNHASFVFHGIDGNTLLRILDVNGFACSSGSACKTGNPEPSEVLNALGLSPEWALGSLRLTLGAFNQLSDIEAFLPVLANSIARLRAQ